MGLKACCRLHDTRGVDDCAKPLSLAAGIRESEVCDLLHAYSRITLRAHRSGEMPRPTDGSISAQVNARCTDLGLRDFYRHELRSSVGE